MAEAFSTFGSSFTKLMHRIRYLPYFNGIGVLCREYDLKKLWMCGGGKVFQIQCFVVVWFEGWDEKYTKKYYGN
jgi:hypothetical protein